MSQYVFTLYRNTVREQLFLQDLGVSFEYTDSIDNYSRRDLIEFVKEWAEEKRPNN